MSYLAIHGVHIMFTTHHAVGLKNARRASKNSLYISALNSTKIIIKLFHTPNFYEANEPYSITLNFSP